MSQDNNTIKLLGIKDPNIKIYENCVEERKIGRNTSLVIKATLSYKPYKCYKCNHPYDKDMVFNGTKTSLIKLPKTSNYNTYLELKKQRVLCRHCGKTFVLATKLVAKHCNISQHTKQAILIEAKDKLSEKQIAANNNVSANTVSRVIFSQYGSLKTNYNHLPETLCFDEFKSTKDAKGSMSFVYMDYEDSRIIDIVEDRRKYSLEKHFSRYSKDVRSNVKFIVLDMYKPYMVLIKEMFPNAKIIIDRFHIVNLINRALNKTRIATMNANKDYYNKLKRYWRLLLKQRDKLDSVHYDKRVCFKRFMSELDIVEYLLESDDTLKNTYFLYQSLHTALKNKDANLFLKILSSQHNSISTYMKTAIKTLTVYKDYIVNALNNSASNGRLEATNNLIKVIKRVAFGFRSFLHFKNRILIIHNHFYIQKKYGSI